MQEKDLLQFHPPYGQVQITAKAKATGYTDSDLSNVVVYNSHPHLAKVNATTLRISNCRAAATSYEVYANGELKGTIAYSGEDGGTLDIDITSLTLTQSAISTFYVKGIGTGVAENQSESVSLWVGSNVILGVSGLYQSEPALTRTDDAVGKTWTMSNNVISSDFDSLFPYNLMKRHTIDGDEFVFIPELYLRIGYDTNGYLTDVAVAPLEMTAGENQVVIHVDAFYFGAYGASVANGKMYSKTGVARQYSTTRANFRTYAKARGEKYRQLDLAHMRVLDFLWLIEFATKNSESVMWGYTGYGQSCGATDSLTVPSGQLASQGRMRWRYIEDFIGNGLEFFDGLTGYAATDDASKYNDNSTGDLTFPSVSGACLSALKIDASKPLLAVPGATVNNSNYNTFFCDYAGLDGSAVCYRGRSSASADVGLFCVSSRNASYGSVDLGSRLLLTL